MNLQEAYQGWQQQSQNSKLYAKTREAFRKAWFNLPTNKDCSYYTKEILGEALAATREIESNKAKAASVMIHVLTFANFAEPEVNPAPDFSFDELMEYTKGNRTGHKPAADDDHDLDIDPVAAAPRKAMEQESVDTIRLREKMQATDFDIKRVETDTAPEPCDKHGGALQESDGSNGRTASPSSKGIKPRGRMSKAYAQIDPETLEVVKIWPSMAEAMRETGARNLERCTRLFRKSKGYYWSQADEVDSFLEQLRVKDELKNLLTGIDAKAKNTKAGKEKKAEAPAPMPKFQPAGEDAGKTTAAQQALAVFTDEELQDELGRRGWHGEVRMECVVFIGKKED